MRASSSAPCKSSSIFPRTSRTAVTSRRCWCIVGPDIRVSARPCWPPPKAARDRGKTLLVLDTASAEAERLYARAGWQRCGVVPGYALLPHGGLCATTFFYRALT